MPYVHLISANDSAEGRIHRDATLQFRFHLSLEFHRTELPESSAHTSFRDGIKSLLKSKVPADCQMT
jgi:succinylarginine dihydrolase